MSPIPKDPRVVEAMRQLAHMLGHGTRINKWTGNPLVPVFLTFDEKMRLHHIEGILTTDKDAIFDQVRQIVTKTKAVYVAFAGETSFLDVPADVDALPGDQASLTGPKGSVTVMVISRDGTTLSLVAPLLADDKMGEWSEFWTSLKGGRFASLWSEKV